MALVEVGNRSPQMIHSLTAMGGRAQFPWLFAVFIAYEIQWGTSEFGGFQSRAPQNTQSNLSCSGSVLWYLTLKGKEEAETARAELKINIRNIIIILDHKNEGKVGPCFMLGQPRLNPRYHI